MIYVSSDWHGDYSIYEQIKKLLNPDDILYFLGDAVDRGPDSIKLFMALMQDSQVKYIPGNHEEMMYNCLMFKPDYEKQQLWFINGGLHTYNEFLDIHDQEKLKQIYSYLITLHKAPQCFNVLYGDKTFYLSHAGFNFGQIADFLWDRNHMLVPNERTNNKMYIIHGHTPVNSIKWNSQKNKVFYYDSENHKIDIDLGVFRTGLSCLLSLGDLENPIYIKSKIFETKT